MKIAVKSIITMGFCFGLAFAGEFDDIANSLRGTITEDHLTKSAPEYITYDQDKVNEYLTDPSTGSLEAEGQRQLREEINNNNPYVITTITAPTADNTTTKQQAEAMIGELNQTPTDVPNLEDLIAVDETGEPNITEALMQYFIATEIASDVERTTDLNKIMNSRVFGGNAMSCSNYNFKNTNMSNPARQKCNVKAKVQTYYQCNDKEDLFNNYDSCANTCDSICKQVNDYNRPKLKVLGFDFANIVGVTEAEKQLAVARAYNACYYTHSKTHKKGNWLYRYTERIENFYCCFPSEANKALNDAITTQLINNGHKLSNRCAGIPLELLDKVDFNEPSILNVIQTQVGGVISNAMLQDLMQTYDGQKHSPDAAYDNKSSMEAEINQRKEALPRF